MAAAQPELSRWRRWGAWILAGIPVAMLLLSGTMKLAGVAEVVRDFGGRFGFPAGTLFPIGLLEVGCTIVYLVPRTSVLGAVLLTGYLGGAVVTHVRVGEPAVAMAPFLCGVFLWGSLWLRDRRLHALLPVRQG